MSVQHTPPNPTPKTSGNPSINLSRRLAPGTIEHLRPSSNPSSSHHTNKKRQATDEVELINDEDSTEGAMDTDELVEILKTTIRETLKEETENALKKMIKSAIQEEISTVAANLEQFAIKLEDNISAQNTQISTTLTDLFYLVDKVIRPKLDHQQQQREKQRSQTQDSTVITEETATEDITTLKSRISELQQEFLRRNRNLKQKLNQNLSTFNKNDKRADLSEEDFEEIRRIRPQTERWYRHSQALEKHIIQEEHGRDLSTNTQSHITITYRQTIIPKENYQEMTKKLQEEANHLNLSIVIKDLEYTLDMITKIEEGVEKLNDYKRAKLWGIVTRKYNEYSDRNIKAPTHQPESTQYRQQQPPPRTRTYPQHQQNPRTPRTPRNTYRPTYNRPKPRYPAWDTNRREQRTYADRDVEDNYYEDFPNLMENNYGRNYRNDKRELHRYQNDYPEHNDRNYHNPSNYNYQQRTYYQEQHRDDRQQRNHYQEQHRDDKRQSNPDPYPYHLN